MKILTCSVVYLHTGTHGNRDFCYRVTVTCKSTKVTSFRREVVEDN